MCDYLVGGCGSSGSGNVNLPPYKDPSGNYWDISGIISNIPQVLPYTGGFNLYKGVWGSPSRHHFRTLKAGTSIELSYDNPDGGAADDTNNSIVIKVKQAATGPEDPNEPQVVTAVLPEGIIDCGIIWDNTDKAWEVANYDNGLGISLGATNLIQFIGGIVDVDSLQMTSSFNMSHTAQTNSIYSFGGNSGGIRLEIETGNSATHKLRVLVKDGSGVTLEGQLGEGLISDGDGGVTWGPSGGGATQFFSLSDVNTDEVPLADGMLTYIRNSEVFLTSEPTSGSVAQWDSTLLEWVFVTGVNNNDVLGWNTATAMWGPITLTLEGLSDVDNQGKQDGYVLAWDQTQGNHQYVPITAPANTFEMSYRFSQGDTEVVDLFIDGFEILDYQSINIAFEQVSINGDPFVNLSTLPTIPSGATVIFKITYSLGYNDGVLAIKGGMI